MVGLYGKCQMLATTRGFPGPVRKTFRRIAIKSCAAASRYTQTQTHHLSPSINSSLHTTMQMTGILAYIATIATLVPIASARWWNPFPCPIPLCLDPCIECVIPDSSLFSIDVVPPQCTTGPTFFYHYGIKCPGCPTVISCGIADTCCRPEDKPDAASCGRSGCTCCGGKWIAGNSGPTLPAKEVCAGLGLDVTQPCPISVDVPGEKCGTVVCPFGQECCNASCGTCTGPGMSCTQEVCTTPADLEPTDV
jgi:hypothetical protein